jgi:threonine dehydrogenase-like Zn-dependent dehydrogenase
MPLSLNYPVISNALEPVHGFRLIILWAPPNIEKIAKLNGSCGPGSGKRVAIFGLGGVGPSALLGARVAGAYPLIAVDISQDKLSLARSLGQTSDLTHSIRS